MLYITSTGRYYDPEIGRYISPCNIEEINPNQINGLNLYCYCLNNPVMVNALVEPIAKAQGISNAALITGSNIGILNGNRSGPRGETLPGWVGTTSDILDAASWLASPLRTFGSLVMHPYVIGLLRMDGLTEIPGALSKSMSILSWSLCFVGGMFHGYNQYQNGASLGGSIGDGIVRTGINIGVMKAGMVAGSFTASTLLATGAISSIVAAGGLAAALTFGGIIVLGAATAYATALALNWVITKWKINGKTIEDWITFWD